MKFEDMPKPGEIVEDAPKTNAPERLRILLRTLRNLDQNGTLFQGLTTIWKHDREEKEGGEDPPEYYRDQGIRSLLSSIHDLVEEVLEDIKVLDRTDQKLGTQIRKLQKSIGIGSLQQP